MLMSLLGSLTSQFITYLDANNLYAWAMSQYLSYRGFKWLNQKETDGKNSSDGYILEVDLEYPDELHELHNDYSLAPENFKISHNMSANYCSSIVNEYGINLMVLVN